MSSHARGPRRRYRKSSGRRVWVFSDLNHDLRPEQVAKIITTAGLERARLEAAAQAEADPRENEEEAGDA
jgi:hypothetical protein